MPFDNSLRGHQEFITAELLMVSLTLCSSVSYMFEEDISNSLVFWSTPISKSREASLANSAQIGLKWPQ